MKNLSLEKLENIKGGGADNTTAYDIGFGFLCGTAIIMAATPLWLVSLVYGSKCKALLIGYLAGLDDAL